MKVQSALLLLSFFFIFSCTDDNNDIDQTIVEPGVVITFDDDYVESWVSVQSVLSEYDWKATFFVSNFNQLSSSQIQDIKDLQYHGHEIGGHGLNHLNAENFISSNGIDSYLNQEIIPMMDLMNNNSLQITSFAYPYGARNSEIDNVLLQKFSILRGTTYGSSSPQYQNCYYNQSQIVNGLGIDNSYSHFSISYFRSLLEYAKKNHKIVIFYAHKPVQNAQGTYETEYQTLIEICQFIKLNNMRFYTISELRQLDNM